MKIVPLDFEIQIEVDDPKAGALDLSATPRAIEVGTVVALGDKVTLDLKKGDKILYKSWALDVSVYVGKKYYFINETSKGVKAVIK